MGGLPDYAFTFRFVNDGQWQDRYGGYYFIHTFPQENGELKATGKTHSCREFFTMSYQSKIMKGLENWYAKAYALITSGQMRNHAYHLYPLERYIDVGVHIINAYESHQGWPLTRAYSVHSPQLEKCMFVIGPKRWTLNRYAFGIWTLLMRLGRCSPFGNAKLFDKVMVMDWPTIVQEIYKAAAEEGTMLQAKFVAPQIDEFFKFEKLAFSKNREENWNPNRIASGLARPEGIYKLIAGESFSPEFAKKWSIFAKGGNVNDWQKT